MRSNTEWIRWGKEDPLYGVIAWADKKKGGPSPWTDEEFYSNGAVVWKTCAEVWACHGLAGATSCLEIGCGAGRVTRALAGSFRNVYAVDVSPDMIEYAKRNIVSSNVSFHLTQGRELPIRQETVDAVFSAFVFQHFDKPQDGLKYFEEIHRVLVPGGRIMIHLPIYQWPTKPLIFNAIYRALMALLRLRANYRRWRALHLMRGIHYDANQVCETLVRLGFGEIEVCALGPLNVSWVFARKLFNRKEKDAAAVLPGGDLMLPPHK